jgi:dienelactone hydrolase
MTSAVTRSSSVRPVRRRLRWAAVGLLLSAAAGAAYLLRDPEPVFDARRGTIVRVDTAATVPDSTAREQVVTLQSSTGLTVRLAVRTPHERGDSTSGSTRTVVKRPLFIVLGGHQRGMRAGALVGDPRGTIFASLEYPFEGDHKAKGLAVVAQVPAIRRAFYDTPPAVSLALDHLLSRPDVDPTRVELVGASFGAPFATIAAARDPRVSRLWIAHGGGKPFRMIEHGLKRDIPIAALRWPIAGLATLLASGPRFAPERWIARVAPRPVVMLSATDDERIPRESVDALWDAMQPPRDRVWLPGKHMQGDRPDVLRTLVDSVLTRAARPALDTSLAPAGRASTP